MIFVKLMRTPKLLLTTLFITALPIAVALSSCSKTDDAPTPASVTVIHAMPKGKPIILVLGDTNNIAWFTSAKTVAYGSATAYSPIAKEIPYFITQTSDSTKRIVKGNLDLLSGKMYSLFVAGDTTQPETVLLQDNIPFHQDSSTGVRFINLSPASLPINVNIKGNVASKTEFSGIAYKQATEFKDYAGTTPNAITGKYIFEVRNQANDSLLLTYTWSFNLFRNYTLVLAGSVTTAGKPTALKLFPVNHF